MSVNELLVSGGAATAQAVWDVTVGELANYVDSTLTRIRGTIVVDPEAGSTSGTSYYWNVLLALLVGPDPAAVDTETDLSSDRIIWTHFFGQSYYVSSDSAAKVAVPQTSVMIPVDIRAQRRLSDDDAIYLSVASLHSSHGCKVHYALRGLFKE